MPRTLSVLALFALVVSGRPVLAGPPEGPSGQMVLDEVTEALLKFRLEPDLKTRGAMIRRLGPVRDPRVTLALMEVAVDEDSPLHPLAGAMLVEYHIPEKDYVTAKCWTIARPWCEKNEAEVRRRAKQLP
jgi:hypothetical protein